MGEAQIYVHPVLIVLSWGSLLGKAILMALCGLFVRIHFQRD